MARPAARLPGPLVTRVRNRTVAKGRLDRICGLEVDPVFCREVVERQQLLLIVDNLRDGLRVLGLVGLAELADGDLGVATVLGVADLGQGSAGGRLGRLGQGVEHVGDLVDIMPNSA